MKFLITWRLHEEKRHDVLGVFSQMTPKQEKAMMGKELKLLGRWHDVVGGTGAAVYEAASVEAISAYSLNWNKYMDLDIVPVMDDAATRSVGSQYTSVSQE